MASANNTLVINREVSFFYLPIAISIVCSLWLIATGMLQLPASNNASFWLLGLASFAVLYVPGISILLLVQARMKTLFEMLGAAFFVSQGCILIVGFVSIYTACNAYNSIQLLGTITLVVNILALYFHIKNKGKNEGSFSETISLSFKQIACFCAISLIVIIIIWLQYRQGDLLNDVGHEIALHLSYVRRYAELPSLTPGVMGHLAGLTAATIFFPWEFSAALVSLISRIDVVEAGLHLRMSLPIAAIGSFIFMIRQIYPRAHYLHYIVFISLMIAAGQLVTLPNSCYAYLINRGACRFLTSVHHADIAMDVMLPFLMGGLFGFFRYGTLKWWLVLCGCLIVSFFEHPREYFQLAVIAPIVCFAWIVVARRHLLATVKRFILVVVCFCLAALICVAVIKFFVHLSDGNNYFEEMVNLSNYYRSHVWGIIKNKYASLSLYKVYALNDFRSGPYYIILISCCIFAFACKSRVMRTLGFAIAFTVFMVSGWELSRKILLMVTYNEILMAPIRFVYLPGYFLLSLSCFVLVERCHLRLAKLKVFATYQPVLYLFMVTIVSLFGFWGYAFIWNKTSISVQLQKTLGYIPWIFLAASLLVYLCGSIRKEIDNKIILLCRKKRDRIITFLASFAVILEIALFSFAVRSQLLLVTLLLSFGGFLLVILSGWRLKDINKSQIKRLPTLYFILSLLMVTIALFPGIKNSYELLLRKMPSVSKQLRYYGLERDSISWLKKAIEPGSTIAVEPLGKNFPPLVVPSFTVPINIKGIVGFGKFYWRQIKGNDPIYPGRATDKNLDMNRKINVDLLWKDIIKYRVNYILVSAWRANAAQKCFEKYPTKFKFLKKFDNGNMIYRVLLPENHRKMLTSFLETVPIQSRELA